MIESRDKAGDEAQAMAAQRKQTKVKGEDLASRLATTEAGHGKLREALTGG